VFRQAAHIEGRDQEAEAGVSVGYALAVCKTTAGSADGLVVTGPSDWALTVDSVVLGTRSVDGGDDTRIDANTAIV